MTVLVVMVMMVKFCLGWRFIAGVVKINGSMGAFYVAVRQSNFFQVLQLRVRGNASEADDNGDRAEADVL